MKKWACILVLGLVVLGVVAFLFFNRRYHDVQTSHANLIKKNGSVRFTAEAWRRANSLKRGKMLASLFSTQKFLNKKRSDVVAMLGENTSDCYYDINPCYSIKYGDHDFTLHFSVGDKNAYSNFKEIDSIFFYKTKNQ